MSCKIKVGIAAAMVLLAVATAPAVLCLGYLAQNIQGHSCCPSKSVPASSVATCCIQPPAVTSQNVVIAVDAAAAPAVVVEPILVTVATRSAAVPNLDTSPPQCSSVLRI
jgi:hypothetical protein